MTQKSYSPNKKQSPTGTKGAPSPPLETSIVLKSPTVFTPEIVAISFKDPICKVIPYSGWWKTVCPWDAIKSIDSLQKAFASSPINLPKSTFNFISFSPDKNLELFNRFFHSLEYLIVFDLLLG